MVQFCEWKTYEKCLQIRFLFPPSFVSPNPYFENPILSTAIKTIESCLTHSLALSFSQRIEFVSPNLFLSDDRFFLVSYSVILLHIFFSSVIHLGIAISKFDFEHSSVIYVRGFGTLRLL